MKRWILTAAVTVATSLALAPAASAESNQPGEGEHSTGRNEAGFGDGPHCHLLVVDSAQEKFDVIRVFPSHRAHLASGTSDGVFVADQDCDGLMD